MQLNRKHSRALQFNDGTWERFWIRFAYLQYLIWARKKKFHQNSTWIPSEFHSPDLLDRLLGLWQCTRVPVARSARPDGFRRSIWLRQPRWPSKLKEEEADREAKIPNLEKCENSKIGFQNMKKWVLGLKNDSFRSFRKNWKLLEILEIFHFFMRFLHFSRIVVLLCLATS